MRDAIGMKKNEPGMEIGFRAYLLIAGLVAGLGACSGESTESLLISAKTHIEKNDRKTAIIQLKNALQKNQSLAEARYLLGKVLLDAGDINGAEVELQKAQELGFDAEKVVPPLAKITLAKGGPSKLLSEYGTTKFNSSKAQADMQLLVAQANLSLGHRAEAKMAVLEAKRLDGGNLSAQIFLARMLATEKNFADARTELDGVLVAAPESSEAWQFKGELFQHEGKSDAALDSFRKSLQFDGANLASQRSAMWLLMAKKDLTEAESQLKEIRKARPHHPQTKFFTALLALENGDLKLAHEQSQQLLKQAGNNVQALHLAGAIDAKRGSLVQAEAALNKALRLEPGQERVRTLLAQVYLRSGDSSRAIKTLQPLMNATQPSWEANALVGQAYLMQGDSGKAETFFTTAAKLNPSDKTSRIALALAQMDKGRTEQGFADLKAIASIDTGVNADLALINSYAMQKDYQSALSAVENLERKQTDQPLPKFIRGQIEVQRGNRAQARSAFEAALVIYPDFFPASESLAALDEKDGSVEKADLRLSSLLQKDPKNIKAAMALFRLRERTGAKNVELLDLATQAVKSNPNEIAPRLALIGLHLGDTQQKLAMTAAQDAVAAIPDSVELLEALGGIQFASGEFAQALATYNKIVALQPNFPNVYMQMAKVHLAKGDSKSANQILKKLLSVNYDHIGAQRALATIAMVSGREKDALAIARSLQSQHAIDSAGFVLEGDIEAQSKRWTRAVAAYRNGLEAEASTALAIRLNMALLADGKKAEAAKMSQQWLSKYPKDAIFRYHLGDLAMKDSDFTLAKSHYEFVLEVLPENAPALNNLAWILNRSKQKGALEYALKASRISPKEPAYMDTLAEIYAQAGKIDEALKVQKVAMALAPQNALHRLHLAQLYLKAGEKKLAKQHLQELASLGDQFNQQAEVKNLLTPL